jgi:putative cardiolipin synthase
MAVALPLSLAACASIDFDYPREESFSMTEADTENTHLAQQIQKISAGRIAGESGFIPQVDGIDALASRLLLANRAEKSIDVQYYLIKNDLVGRTFIHSLLAAADRGVRVRVLLDDVFTSGYDAGLRALQSHPNFEIRIFNPFNRGAVGRSLGAIPSFGRVNRRMHNKTFTVDRQITVIGGRNIADEYFGAREDSKFGDLDVIGIGPVVDDVANMFDLYWNHETALPVEAFTKELDNPDEGLDTLRRELQASVEAAKQSRYAEAVIDRAFEQIEAESGAITWAPYSLVYDSPDKGVRKKAGEAGTVLTPLQETIAAATKEVLIVSPYFVPRKGGIEALKEIQGRGVDVTVITNSLAANNQFTVHAGYSPSRKPLLQNGIKLYEVRPDATVKGTEYVDSEGARATLHTKAFIVDQRHVFIGSFNFDPRSANINTEMGVIIDDAELGSFFSQRVGEGLATQAYAVFLDDKGRVRWRGQRNGATDVYENEPETSWWQRFKVGFVRLLPIRGQL